MKKFFLFTIFIGLLFSTEAKGVVTISNPIASTSFTQLITKISTAVSAFIGAIAVVILIIAGIYFLISAGDPGKVQKAKEMVKYAVIGIVIALTAGTIVVLIKWVLGIP